MTNNGEWDVTTKEPFVLREISQEATNVNYGQLKCKEHLADESASFPF